MNSRSTVPDGIDGARSARFGMHSIDGIEYTYHLTFARVPAGVAWRAIVRDGAGALRATPRGLLRNAAADDADLDARLRAAVVAAIDSP